jgi:putative flavoprotein involved in K+ transport
VLVSVEQSPDVVVVGAGPAGIATSCALASLGVDHVVLERGRIGETWRTQRWDSFRLNTPSWMNTLGEGLPDGVDPEGFGTADDLTSQLVAVRDRRRLPVVEHAEVLDCVRRRGRWVLATGVGSVAARRVVAASGAQNVPRVPRLDAGLPRSLERLHAADYRRPEQLPSGAVLVVGGGQTGVAIAQELVEAGRTVYLATSRVGRIPRRYRGRDTLTWWDAMGLYAQTLDDLPGRRPPRQPQVSGSDGGRTISFQSLARDGVVLLGSLARVALGELVFAGNLAENVAFADDESTRTRAEIDAHIARSGWAPPPVPDAADEPASSVPDPPRTLGLRETGIASVIWATGFTAAEGWRSGLVPEVGTPWLRTRGSGILHGFRADAHALALELVEPRAARQPEPRPPRAPPTR